VPLPQDVQSACEIYDKIYRTLIILLRVHICYNVYPVSHAYQMLLVFCVIRFVSNATYLHRIGYILSKILAIVS